MVCNDVEIEPGLQLLNGEYLQAGDAIRTDDARLDIRARGFWRNVRVTNPNNPHQVKKKIEKVYDAHEKEKNPKYGQRPSMLNTAHLLHLSTVLMGVWVKNVKFFTKD